MHQEAQQISAAAVVSWTAANERQSFRRESHIFRYGSLSYHFHEANKEARNVGDFLFQISVQFTTYFVVSCFLLLVAFLIMTVMMMYFGLTNLKECPRKPQIPVYLLVGGCCGMLKVLILLWKQRRLRSEKSFSANEPYLSEIKEGDEIYTTKSTQVAQATLLLFLLIWFLVGNYWIFSIYIPPFSPPREFPQNWCNKSLYLFAVGHICFVYSILAVLLLTLLVVLIAIKRSMLTSSLPAF